MIDRHREAIELSKMAVAAAQDVLDMAERHKNELSDLVERLSLDNHALNLDNQRLLKEVVELRQQIDWMNTKAGDLGLGLASLMTNHGGST